jgi:hypothetical protein
MTLTAWLGKTPPMLSLPLRGSERNVTAVLARAVIGSMVGIMVGGRVGSGVKVAVGSEVLVGFIVGEGCGVSDDVSVGVSTERRGWPQLVSNESSSKRTKNRIRFKGSPERCNLFMQGIQVNLMSVYLFPCLHFYLRPNFLAFSTSPGNVFKNESTSAGVV